MEVYTDLSLLDSPRTLAAILKQINSVQLPGEQLVLRLTGSESAKEMSPPSRPFGIYCDPGSQFLVCLDADRFLGCCLSTTCHDHIYTFNDYTLTSFDAAYYGEIPDQNCMNPYISKWYTCRDNGFVGCCSSPPCDGGCPAENLTSATLSSNPQFAKVFVDYAKATDPSSSAPSTRIKIGAAVGGSLALVLLAGLILWIRRCLRAKRGPGKKGEMSMSKKAFNITMSWSE